MSYKSPFETRYASSEMLSLFDEKYRIKLFRKLWIALAEEEKKAGVGISDEQIAEMKAHADEVDLETIKEYEKQFRHDVMANVHAFGKLCPNAKPIIHLGATSCFVTDNADLLIYYEGLDIIAAKVAEAVRVLAEFAAKYKKLPALAYTHFQSAQPTTVGKRAATWFMPLLDDLTEIENLLQDKFLLGVKGATGTQASFLELLGSFDKVKKVDESLCARYGCRPAVVSGQTYDRKFDDRILCALSHVAISAAKFANDVRLLQHEKEIEEPFKEKQIGSSAMPYKRNPMLCERTCGLARFLINLRENTAQTASVQWLERTLDDSVNRRLVMSQAFLAADSILKIVINVASGLVVNKQVIASRLRRELPFMATENIMMECVKKGGDRQVLHEKIRQYSLRAAEEVKCGKQNKLLQYIAEDPDLGVSPEELKKALSAEKYTGCAAEQTAEAVALAKKRVAKYTKLPTCEVEI